MNVLNITRHLLSKDGVNTPAACGKLLKGALVAVTLMATSMSYAQNLVAQKDRERSQVAPRIIGGTTVPSGERSFQVSLHGDSNNHACGGSIIADSWLLTAAHCVDSGTPSAIVSDTYNLTSGGTRHGVAQVVIHPDWQKNGFGRYSDIALIRINDTFAPNLERLQLATASIMQSVGPGTVATVSGWGLTSGGGNISNQLLQTTNTVISNGQCRRLARDDINDSIVVCAHDSGRGSCNGDSGGPYTIDNNGVTYSLGVVSFGPQTCDSYSAYTKTSAFVDWINGYTGGTSGGADNGNDNTLSNDQPVTVSGSRGSDVNYTFTLPSDVSSYTVSISGGRGDADLFVRADVEPTNSHYDCRPYLNGSNESCTQDSPAAGTYYVRVNAYEDFSGVSLRLSYQGGPSTDPDSQPTPDPEPTACTSGFEEVSVTLNGNGAANLGNGYSAYQGTHSFISISGDVQLTLRRWVAGWWWGGSWEVVQSAQTELEYYGNEGDYLLSLSDGTPGATYKICASTP